MGGGTEFFRPLDDNPDFYSVSIVDGGEPKFSAYSHRGKRLFSHDSRRGEPKNLTHSPV